MILKIDREFKNLIPQLSSEEYAGLEASLKSEGCRDSIVVWNDTIIDGHNRHEICTKNNIPFRTHIIDLPDRDAVIDWMYSNQLARRNLTDTMKMVLIGKQYAHRKKAQGGYHGNQYVAKGQNDPLANTAEKIAQEQGVSEKTVKRAEKLAEAIETIGDLIGQEAKQEILKETVTPTRKEILDVAQELKEATPERVTEIKNSGLFTSESAEWYTPKEIIDSVIEVLEIIDLDPCSDGKNVPATIHYTKSDDGLSKEWKGAVYMNPPYGSEIKVWVEKLLSEHEKGNITEAIALVPARTDTQWFVMFGANPWCAVEGRLKFSGSKNSAPFPSAIFYLSPTEDSGEGADRFHRVFSKHGIIYQERF
jgi:phage N-6-adenine-methyltransferase